MSQLGSRLQGNCHAHTRSEQPLLGKLQPIFNRFPPCLRGHYVARHRFQSPPLHITASSIYIAINQRRSAAEAQHRQFMPVFEEIVYGSAALDYVGNRLLSQTTIEIFGGTFPPSVDVDEGKPIAWTRCKSICHL